MSAPDPTHPPQVSTPADEESVLWEGTPSQWQNFGWWLSCLLVIPIPIAIWKAVSIANYRITLTRQRLRIRSGIFSKHNEDIELYRVKDWSLKEPFLQRLFGAGEIEIISSDRTAPELTLSWIPGPGSLVETLRAAVEAVRDSKRVREVDMGFDDGDELEII